MWRIFKCLPFVPKGCILLSFQLNKPVRYPSADWLPRKAGWPQGRCGLLFWQEMTVEAGRASALPFQTLLKALKKRKQISRCLQEPWGLSSPAQARRIPQETNNPASESNPWTTSLQPDLGGMASYLPSSPHTPAPVLAFPLTLLLEAGISLTLGLTHPVLQHSLCLVFVLTHSPACCRHRAGVCVSSLRAQARCPITDGGRPCKRPQAVWTPCSEQTVLIPFLRKCINWRGRDLSYPDPASGVWDKCSQHPKHRKSPTNPRSVPAGTSQA